MSVFRRRVVFRDAPDTRLLGGASIVTATVSVAAIVFATTVSGATSSSGTTGDTSTPIVFGFGPISQGTLEVASTMPVVFGVTGTGQQVSPTAVSAPTVLSVTARCDALITAPIAFTVTATVGSVFTQDTSANVVFGVTVASQVGGPISAPVVFSCAPGTPDISGGTVESAADAAVVWSVAATGAYGASNTTPDLFFIPARFNVPRNTVITFESVTIQGNTQPAILEVTNGEYSIDGGAFDAIPTTINAGQTLTVRHTSAISYSTQTVTFVNVGGVLENAVSVTERAPEHRTPRHHRKHFQKRRHAK